MDPVALLAELRALADDVPDFSTYNATSRTHLEWLGKAHALIAKWEPIEAIKFAGASNQLAINALKISSVAEILGALHRAIAAVELTVPKQASQAFGPGAVYDVHKSVRELLASATKSVFVVDPYLDEQVFDGYLSGVSKTVTVRLMTRQSSASLKPAVEKFVAQFKMSVEVRTSSSLHDRVVFLDNRSCWVLGQSIKDAAKSKPTYLAPLSTDATKLKLADYEKIWANSTIL